MATNEQDILTKRCSGCGEILSISEFNKDTTRKDGLQRWCKTCNSKYKKQWKKDNPDKVKAARKKDRIINADYYKNWRKQHKEYLVEYSKKRYKNKKDDKEFVLKRNEQQKNWRAANPVKRRLARKKRKHAEKCVENTLTPEQWNKILEMQDSRCNLCKKKFTSKNKPTMDHIIPLSQGYGLTFENTQAVCHLCNTRKRAKIVPSLIVSWIEKPEMCISQEQSYEYARASEASVSALR